MGSPLFSQREHILRLLRFWIIKLIKKFVKDWEMRIEPCYIYELTYGIKKIFNKIAAYNNHFTNFIKVPAAP